jgi:hypothetical protein
MIHMSKTRFVAHLLLLAILVGAGITERGAVGAVIGVAAFAIFVVLNEALYWYRAWQKRKRLGGHGQSDLTPEQQEPTGVRRVRRGP